MAVAGAGLLLILYVLFCLLFSFFRMYRKKVQLPPGPMPWFFLGNMLQKDVLPLYKNYPKLVDKYGPIFTVWMGTKPLVAFCGYEAVKDSFVLHDEEFSGRPASPVIHIVSKNQGLSTTDMRKWREMSQFILSTMREIGMGARSMSEKVQEEAHHLVEEMAATQGQAFDPTRKMTSAVFNVMCSVLFGQHFDYEDEILQENLRILADHAVFIHSPFGKVLSAFPKILKYLPGPHKKVEANGEKLCAYIRERMEYHSQTLDPQNPRDYIDYCLIRMKKRKYPTESTLSAEDFVKSIYSLAFAGSFTTSQVLLHALLLMIKYPHIQAKVQREIDEVVGNNHAPDLKDRVKMPFTQAVIHEVLRYQKGSTEAIQREVIRDVEVRGYTIPKGTSAFVVFTSMNFDPLHWDTPEKFNPGHFLNEEGQFRKRDDFIPFLAGRRKCLGESLARTELFLFLSTLLQNFTFQLPGDAKDVDIVSLYLDYTMSKQYPLIKAIRR